jgi:hypothetical protein
VVFADKKSVFLHSICRISAGACYGVDSYIGFYHQEAILGTDGIAFHWK